MPSRGIPPDSNGPEPPDAGPGPANPEVKISQGGLPRVRLLFAVAVIVLAGDVISKAAVVATLSSHAPVRLLGGLLTLRVLRNSGAAFSIGTSMTIAFTAIAVGVIGYILRTARRLRSLPWAIVLGLLLGGATGNLLDRLFRSPAPLRGYVVDWIELPHWPVFNLADSAIVCGGILAVLLAARGLRLDGTRDQARRPAEDRLGHDQADGLRTDREAGRGAVDKPE